MDNGVVDVVLNVILIIQIALLIPAAYRIVVGPRIADRLLGVDMITTLLTGSIVLLAVIADLSLLVDVALAIALLAFIGTVATARFVAQGRVF